ncbi:MAG: hypothetical protein FWH26_01445 [Oscillospiraceae bacterium]|nr:hypothetical protein [Oscillospiraceae bacterium]
MLIVFLLCLAAGFFIYIRCAELPDGAFAFSSGSFDGFLKDLKERGTYLLALLGIIFGTFFDRKIFWGCFAKLKKLPKEKALIVLYAIASTVSFALTFTELCFAFRGSTRFKDPMLLLGAGLLVLVFLYARLVHYVTKKVFPETMEGEDEE